MHCNNNVAQFRSSFNVWTVNAQQFNVPQVISQIIRLALTSFENNEKKLDLTQLPAGISTTTLQHAKNNYQAAFLVNTALLEKIIEQWHKNASKGQNCKNAAILQAMIFSSKIADKELCSFLKRAQVKAIKGWFIYQGKSIAVFNAFIQCRGCSRPLFMLGTILLLKKITSPFKKLLIKLLV